MNTEKPKDSNTDPDNSGFAERFTATQEAMGQAEEWKNVNADRQSVLVAARLDGAVGPEVAYHDQRVEQAAMMEDIARSKAEKLADPRSRVKKLADFVLRRHN